MHVEALGLKFGEATGHNLEALPDGFEILQAFVDAEILLDVIGAELVPQEGRKLFVLLDERVFKVGAENMVAVVDAVQDGLKLAVQPFAHPRAEDFRDFSSGHAPETDIAGAFEDFADREVSFEDEVPAVFDLGQSVKAAQVHCQPLALGKLGSEHQRAVLEPILNDLSAEPIGGGL